MANFPTFKKAGLYCQVHEKWHCDICAEQYLIEGIKMSDRRIAELEQRLAAAEAKLDELDKELFVFASDVIYSENEKIPNWLVDKARAIYYRPCLGKGE